MLDSIFLLQLEIGINGGIVHHQHIYGVGVMDEVAQCHRLCSQAAADFVARSAEYLDAHHQPGWSAGMAALITGGEHEELVSALVLAIDLFPYT